MDRLGLLGLWREGLLAKAVIEGKTRGYRKHPQLRRFLEHGDPLVAINSYLYFVYLEGKARGYCFDPSKISKELILERIIPVTSGQLAFELSHLLKKLERRDYNWYLAIKENLGEAIEPNPIFYVVEGGIEEWEKAVRYHR